MSSSYRLLEELKRRSETQSVTIYESPGGGGSGEPLGPGFGQRLAAVEASIISIDKTLAVMSERLTNGAPREELRVELATLSTKLDSKASAADLVTPSGKIDPMALATDLAELKGRVARIPTVPVLTSILVFVSLLFAAFSWTVRHLPETWSRALQ